MRPSRLLTCVLASCLLAASTSATASMIAYDTPIQSGNQVWPGSLGMDFDVLAPITVDRLGVFDSGGDGLASRLTATIYDRQTQAAVASLTFGAGFTGTLVNGSRFLALPAPLALAAGFQGSIVASGYGANEPNGNLGCLAGAGASCLGNTIVPSSMNTGGGLIAFVGSARYSNGTGFPTSLDSGPANRYLAGTFSFEPTAIPEPASLLLVGMGAIAVARRRSLRK